MTARTPDEEALALVVGGRHVAITHPDRVVWPVTGTTKRELVAYLLAAAPLLLPHLAGRATMLWRFPEGVEGKGWFQAQCRSRPPWVRTADVVGKRGDLLRYCLVDELATLAWLANLGTIELHPHLWTVDRPREPTALVFDLDPGPPAGLASAARVAMLVQEAITAIGLETVVKTSGRLGLHVVVPLTPGHTFAATKTFAPALASRPERSRPDLVVARNARVERAGRVYIDWIQNDANRQLIAPYSARATTVPSVSVPLGWDEVEALARNDISPASLRFDLAATPARVERVGDLWAAASPGSLPIAADRGP